MLQQTTVAAVKPYYARFLERWPNVMALASAPLEAVMQAWAGLGYYARARNLHACAIAIARCHGGRFPQTEAELRALPGIGLYTASAIAAIAFDRPTTVVDVNVERVVSRLFAIGDAPAKAKPAVRAAAASLTPSMRPGDFAQALMDLGSTICIARRPNCAICPLRQECQASLSGLQESLPRKPERRERPVRAGAAYFISRSDGCVLVRTRPPKGLLGGMTEIPSTQWCENFNLSAALGEAPLSIDYRVAPEAVEHGFTHFRLRLTVFTAIAQSEAPAPPGYRWVPGGTLTAEGFPTVMRKVVDVALEQLQPR